MRLRFLNFVFFIGFFSISAQAVEDIYAEKKAATVRSFQKLQKNHPELKEPLAGLDYLEQGLHIQAHFSLETAHEAYNLPLPDKVLKPMNHALSAYKQGQTLEPQEVTQSKSQILSKLKRQPVFRSASSNTEAEEMARSKSPSSKIAKDQAKPISKNKSFELDDVQKISPSNINPFPVEVTHLNSEKEKSPLASPEKSPPPKRSETPKRSEVQKERSSWMQKIFNLRGKKGKEREKRKSANPELSRLPELSPLSPLTDFSELKKTAAEGERLLKTGESPSSKRPESPRKIFIRRQFSSELKEEKKRSINLEIQPFASKPTDLTQKEEKQEGSFLLFGMKAQKTRKTLRDFFDDYFKIVAEKKFEGTQSASYFENLDPMEEFEKAINQTLFTEAYKPIILPVAGEKPLSPLVFVLGTLNQIFFIRFSDQPVYAFGKKTDPVIQSRFDCLYTWELIEQLNNFQRSESKTVTSFLPEILPPEEMKQTMKFVFDTSFKIQDAILGIAETAPPETLEKIGTALYLALYDGYPYAIFLEDFENPRELLELLEFLARHYLATSRLFNPKSVREQFEFQGMKQRQAVVEAFNHAAKRFKKPPFSHAIGHFETTELLENYVSQLRQEAEAWVTFGFGSLNQALK